MITRRTLLGGLAAAAATAPFTGSALASATPRASLALTLVNSTGAHAGKTLWAYVVGTNLATGRQSRVTADGALVPVSTADNGGDGYTDYAIAVNGSRTIPLPQGMSGRIYLSVGDKLKFRANPGDALAYPAGWVSTDPNYRVLHDCVEFTYDGSGMHCNTTMVDMLSVPMSIDLVGNRTQSAGRLVAGGRSRVFQSMRAQSGFSNLVIDDLRVIAPGHGLNAGRFSGGYLAGHIDEVWSRYRGQNMVVNANNTTFTGRVQGDLFVFDRGVRAFAKPSTRDVLFCDGTLAAPNDGVTGPVAAVLGAGLNRGILLNTPQQPVTDAGSYYRIAQCNHYSRIMHKNTVDRKAYGFAFDDVCEHAPYIEDGAPRTMTVTATPF
ncbi:beta-1,3-glucanase family protein [Actinokineospora spheciospongiae]|uniref:beta-1,3-glucanase family protein n=1 Tax=Actinokineospora spheciospongiae TaxID=909613 RepID=UPI000D70FB51|nr:beta-1,3-glucanase family protein [Actinokineospora spheciospongiae]PWW56982.1 beta-1,3-glucanase [Actinokineospora spheciospongiae]